jgi:hypothetical protein
VLSIVKLTKPKSKPRVNLTSNISVIENIANFHGCVASSSSRMSTSKAPLKGDLLITSVQSRLSHQPFSFDLGPFEGCRRSEP